MKWQQKKGTIGICHDGSSGLTPYAGAVGLCHIVVTMQLRALCRFFVRNRGLRCWRSSTTRLCSAALRAPNFRGQMPAKFQKILPSQFLILTCLVFALFILHLLALYRPQAGSMYGSPYGLRNSFLLPWAAISYSHSSGVAYHAGPDASGSNAIFFKKSCGFVGGED